ncbi:MAG: DUF1631 family protein [Comamonas sp.]
MNFAKVPVSVLRTCLVQAVRNAQALALRFVQRAQVVLQPLDSVPLLSGETAVRAVAYQDLLRHHDSLVNGYPQALLEALLQAARQPFSSSATNGGIDHLTSCAPLDQAAQRQSLLRRQLQQELASQVELALADLDSLVSAAQGMARVQPESNPLRPENYLRALAQVIGSIPVDAAVAECWLQCMGRSLGSLLASEYARAAAYLREQGVVPARYGQPAQSTDALLRRRSDRAALQRPGWQAAPQYGDAMGQSRAYAAQHEDLLTLRVLQELISDPRWIDDNLHSIPQALTDSMLQGLGEPSHAGSFGLNRTDLGVLSPLLAEPDVLQAGWTSYSATALETIQHHPSQIAQLFKAVEPAPTVSPQVRTLLRMMVHMTGDVRLQPAVQRVLRSLEPVLIQLVEFDGRFFEDSQHPARLLLDELTARSLWFPNEAAPGFAHFMQVTQAAAVQLTSLPTVDAQGFAQVLQHMREGWSRAGEHALLQQPAAAGLNRAPQQSSYHGPLSAALKFADEHRRSAHEVQASMPDSAHIAQAIARLPSAQGVPEDILDFVTGPWAEVIASAQQRQAPQAGQPENDPGGYMALVPSLLWSVSAHACTDARRLAMLAPRLQTRLANGLRSVGRTEIEIQALAARLAGLHQDALDTGLAQASSRPEIAAKAGVLDMLPSMLDSLDGADETLHAPLQKAGVLNLPRSGASAKERSGLSWQTRPTGVLEAAFAGSPSVPAELPASWKKSAVAQLHKAQGATDFDVLAAKNSGPQTLFSRAELTSPQPEEEWALGCWVELSNERQQLRTRLTWVSPQQTLFLFTAADGSTQSMTRRMRDKLLAQGQLQRINRQ